MLISRFPAAPAVNPADILLRCAAATEPLQGGDARVLDFLDQLGRLLREKARQYPALGALGSWLRRTHLAHLWADLAGNTTRLRFPRGLVFHIAPGNADTVFVYAWALAALAGNCNVVRLSTRSGVLTDVIIDAMARANADPVVAQTQYLLSYPHTDVHITAAFSAACDLRVLWGGDASINATRQQPLRPAARDLTFANRASFALIDAAAFNQAAPAGQQALLSAFYTDVYLFDQAACASPATLIWVGPAATVEAAQAVFFSLLEAEVAARGLQLDAAMAIEKFSALYGLAIAGTATALRFSSNEIAQADLTRQPPYLCRHWSGAGAFPQLRLATLDALIPLLQRTDQTLAYYGFSVAEMQGFAQRAAHKGLDRIVPIGQALAFAPVWDGYDLLREFTRLVSVD